MRASAQLIYVSPFQAFSHYDYLSGLGGWEGGAFTCVPVSCAAAMIPSAVPGGIPGQNSRSNATVACLRTFADRKPASLSSFATAGMSISSTSALTRSMLSAAVLAVGAGPPNNSELAPCGVTSTITSSSSPSATMFVRSNVITS